MGQMHSCYKPISLELHWKLLWTMQIACFQDTRVCPTVDGQLTKINKTGR